MDQILRIYRVLRWVMFAAFVVSMFLLLKTPAPVALPLEPATARLDAESFQQKLADLQAAQSGGENDVHFTAGEVNAAIEQSMAPQSAPVAPRASQSVPGPASQPVPAESGQVPIKSTQVTFTGEVVVGQFLAEVYGKDLYITVAGHLGSRDGYATFDPTEFKVGDLSVPVSLVNPTLQRKLAEPENRDKLKLPDFVKGLRVEGGELVITR